MDSGRSTKKRPKIIAHRGASFAAPENTIAAIGLAWKLNADAVEIDVYLTRDGQIAVIHDRTTERLTGVNLNIEDATLAELKALDVGKWKGKEWTAEKIPTLAEVLATIPGGKRLVVEIKSHAQIVPLFLRTLKECGKGAPEVEVISFWEDVVPAVKQAAPELEVYWLCSPGEDKAEEQVSTALAAGADGIDIQATDLLDADYVSKIREAKLGLYVWTVDDDATALRMADLGVDAITTNKPEELLQLFTDR